jgi:acylphosphatase
MTGQDPSSKQRLVARVHGSVQGVGFRWFAQQQATRLGIEGWVANQADGTVEVVAEGRRDALEAMEIALREGPAGASVREVVARYEPARGNLSGFVVRSGAHRGD